MIESINEIDSCEVCGSKSIRPVLNLGPHAMCDDLVAIGDSRVCNDYPIEIMFCDRCITAHQRFQIPKQVLFPTSYHYRARHTADVLSGMRQLVNSCVQVIGPLKGKRVLDVGCNDGSLLSIFKEHEATTFGIEPTGAAGEARENDHIVINAFMTEEVARQFVTSYGHPDLITFTNVFAHIEDLRSLLRSLKTLLAPHTVIVIENHYLGAILEKNQFDTFYHEHPRSYSYTSFSFIADSLEMKITKAEFPQRYGGNIRVFLGFADSKLGHDRWSELHGLEKTFGAVLERLSASVERWRISKLAEIAIEVQRYGKLPAKAFPGRAAIPIRMLGLDEQSISAVYEKPGSGKIGHYVPGTRIPILSDSEFTPGDAPLLNLAWHISSEIRSYMSGCGYHGRYIDIISSKDF